VPAVQPDRRRQSWVGSTLAEQRGQAAAQPAASAADSPAVTAAADFHTAEEPKLPAAVLQRRTSPALARHEDVSLSSSDIHARSHHVNGSPQQPRVPGPPVQSTVVAAAPKRPADARPGPHDGGFAAAVSTSSSLLAIPSHAVTGSGSDSSSVGPSSAVQTGGSASSQQQALQQSGGTTAATAGATQGVDGGMAPKTLQQARAEMLQRQEAAKARHVSGSQLLVWCWQCCVFAAFTMSHRGTSQRANKVRPRKRQQPAGSSDIKAPLQMAEAELLPLPPPRPLSSVLQQS
jgi:hypothetical protein